MALFLGRMSMVASEWNDPHNGADDTKEFREWQEKQVPTPADLAAVEQVKPEERHA